MVFLFILSFIILPLCMLPLCILCILPHNFSRHLLHLAHHHHLLLQSFPLQEPLHLFLHSLTHTIIFSSPFTSLGLFLFWFFLIFEVFIALLLLIQIVHLLIFLPFFILLLRSL